MSEQPDPQAFDVDAWLTGAKLPEHSVEVYQRADLLADADHLVRQIQQAETDEDLDRERSVGDRLRSEVLREEYERLMDDFKASALTIRVRAVTESETQVLDAKVDRGEVRKEDRPLHEIVIAAVQPELTLEQVRRMQEVLGPQQVVKIWNAVFRATGEQPEVSPHFLPKRSGQGTGQE